MSRKFGVPARYTFTLTVDVAELDARVGCIPAVKTFAKIPKNSTKLEDVYPSHVINFLDPNKRNCRWVITMRDSISGVYLGETYTCKCWRCHQLINGQILGCPIKHVSETTQDTYYSYAQKKDITVEGKPDDPSEYYLTKGMFCDWGCVMGHAEENRHKIEYRESIQLIGKMYKEAGFTGQPHASPHFSVLTEYGGFMTPEEYKARYHLDTYKETGNAYVRMVPVGDLFKVSSKF
jgi:hypothetical protein